MENLKNKIVKYGEWRVLKVCTQCNKRLTEDQIYFKDNICPFCGYGSGRFCANWKAIKMRKVYTYIPSFLERIFKLKKSEWYWERK
jgi:hypothetical protein